MKLNIKKGTTSKLIEVFISDSSSTTGAGLTGILFNSAGLTAYYFRNGVASSTAITLVTMTLGTWASSGFIEMDSANMPGWYQIGLPDAVIATGVDSVGIHFKGATNMAPLPIEIQLIDNTNKDIYDRIGAPAAASIAADLVVIDNFVDELESRLTALRAGYLDNLSAGAVAQSATALSTADWTGARAGYLDELAAANIPADIDDIKGATFDTATDSLEAIRDRGDAAWTTGAGGSDRLLMVDTTIATLASQTSFTINAGSADDNAYNNCTIVIEDTATATQKAVGLVSNYVGATKTVTLKYDPAIFTIAVTDKVYILAENALKSTDANRQLDVTATGAAGFDWSNIENPATAVDLSGTDIQLCDTVTTLTGHTNQTGDTFAQLPTNFSSLSISAGGLIDILQSAADKVWSTAIRLLTAGTNIVLAKGVGLTGLNDLSAAQVNTEVDNALNTAIPGVPTVDSMNERIAAIDDKLPTGTISDFDEATDTVANVTTCATNTDMRGTDGANTTTPPTVVAIRTEIDSNSTQLSAIKAKTDNQPEGLQKNIAFSNFYFTMIDSTDNISPKTGLTITAQRSLDGGAYAAMASSATEIGNGTYVINLAAADTNGDSVRYRFSAIGALATEVTFKTVT